MRNKSITQLIKDRRTIRRLSDRPLSLDEIYPLLETASFAPFHSKEEPWKVYTISSEKERTLLVEAIMVSYDRLDIWATYDPAYVEKAKRRTQSYFSEVPVSLIITAPYKTDECQQLEATAAVAAFIQNFQLAAWEEHIGVTWRTIPVIVDPLFKQALGIVPQEQIIGLLDLTALDPSMTIPKAKRASFTQWTRALCTK